MTIGMKSPVANAPVLLLLDAWTPRSAPDSVRFELEQRASLRVPSDILGRVTLTAHAGWTVFSPDAAPQCVSFTISDVARGVCATTLRMSVQDWERRHHVQLAAILRLPPSQYQARQDVIYEINGNEFFGRGYFAKLRAMADGALDAAE